MKTSKLYSLSLMLLVGLGSAVPSMAQDKSTTEILVAQGQDKDKSKPEDNTTTSQKGPGGQPQGIIGAGKKQKVYGLIVRRDGNNLVVRDRGRAEFNINVSDTTKISERKKNPFRTSRVYDTASLTRGLWVEVEGVGNDSGAIIADKVKFTDEEWRDATSLEARVDPVEDRVTDTEGRLTQAEQNAQRLSGQIEELNAVANMARGGAKAAQETADRALAEINTTNEKLTATNQRVGVVDDRITAVDDFEAKNTVNVNFKVGSAVLSDEAKTSLDELAEQTKNEKGYVIQIAGFASADGSQDLNRKLSERRANAVIRYLIESHDIPQRRIIVPFGYGELKPVADNTTREGREQNRRVEVSILVSRGLAGSGGGEKSSLAPQQ